MKDTILNFAIKMQNMMHEDEGQDLIEYALIVALIALAATAGMSALAGQINAAFTTVGNKLNSYA